MKQIIKFNLLVLFLLVNLTIIGELRYFCANNQFDNMSQWVQKCESFGPGWKFKQRQYNTDCDNQNPGHSGSQIVCEGPLQKLSSSSPINQNLSSDAIIKQAIEQNKQIKLSCTAGNEQQLAMIQGKIKIGIISNPLKGNLGAKEYCDVYLID